MNKTLIGSILAALGFMILFAFVIPGYKSYKSTVAKRDEKKVQLDLIRTARDNILKLSKEYDSKSGEISRMSVFMPENERLDYIITSLEAATSQSGMQLVAINITDGGVQTNANFKSILVDLYVSGTYASYLTFLRTIEKSLRIYDIESFSVSAAEGGLVDADLSMKAYFLTDNI